MNGLGTFLAAIAGPVVKRALQALGFGVVSYAAMKTALDAALTSGPRTGRSILTWRPGTPITLRRIHRLQRVKPSLFTARPDSQIWPAPGSMPPERPEARCGQEG